MSGQDVLNIVVLLNSPAEVGREYHDRIRAGAANVAVHVINDVSEIDRHLPSMDVLMTYGAFLRDRAGEIFRKAPRLRWIQALGSGIDNLDVETAGRGDIVVTCIRGIHDGAVSEAALAAMLALSRDLPRAFRNQQSHIWDRRPARLLEGKTVGLLGVGLIAQKLARRCKAFDMTVVGISSRRERVEGFDAMRSREDLPSAVADLDILVVLAPYTRENHHLVNAPVLKAMKPEAYLVNVARGGVVDEAALIDALERGALAGAALDVFAEEPLPHDHRLWDMPNVIITPHTAGMNVDYVRRAMPTVLANIRAFRAHDLDAMAGLIHRPAVQQPPARIAS